MDAAWDNSRAVIVVAGGSGQRMGSDIPKQFLPIAGVPIVVHTLSLIQKLSPNTPLYLVLHPDWFVRWQDICFTFTNMAVIPVVKGGVTRTESVLNGLHAVKAQQAICQYVAVHDAVRPFVPPQAFFDGWQALQIHQAAICCEPVVFSIRQKTELGSVALDRSLYYEVQTPQFFDFQALTQAYQSQNARTFTDDAAVIEANGIPVHLINGSTDNIKITSPQDLERAALIYKRLKDATPQLYQVS